MTETAFCPGPSCQREQPVVGEGEERRCGYCKRLLPEGVVETEPPPPDLALQIVLNRLAAIDAWRVAVEAHIGKMDTMMMNLLKVVKATPAPKAKKKGKR